MRRSRFEKGLERLAEAFETGTPWALSEALDRLIGKPKQSLEASGQDGGPLETLVKIIHIGAKGVSDETVPGRG